MKRILPYILSGIFISFLILYSYELLENRYQDLRPEKIRQFLEDDSITETVYDYFNHF